VILKIDSLRKTVDKDLQAHTAVHEAGHAVLAVMTLRILPSLIVSKSAADGCDGFCMVNMPEGLFTREILKKDKRHCHLPWWLCGGKNDLWGREYVVGGLLGY
jgi:hypothetical protein